MHTSKLDCVMSWSNGVSGIEGGYLPSFHNIFCGLCRPCSIRARSRLDSIRGRTIDLIWSRLLEASDITEPDTPLSSEAEAAERLANSIRTRTGTQRLKRQQAVECAARIKRFLALFPDETGPQMSDADLALCKSLERKLVGRGL
jgi:hypothetical protein